MEFIYWDHSLNASILLNLAIVIILFTSLRLFSAKVAHISTISNILKIDNAALGISLAGVTFGVAIMLSGTIYGYPNSGLFTSALYVLTYGIIGIILMGVTRIIFDKFTLPNISIREEISKGNIAVGLVDAANVIAAAIIIKSLMMWVTHSNLQDLIAVLIGFAISQVILTSALYIKRFAFRRKHAGYRIQQELKDGNIALALSFSGRKIATAFAITIASNFDFFEVYDFTIIFMPWIIICIIAVLVLHSIAYLASRVVLFNVATMSEILDKRNITVGAIHAAVYVSIGLIISGL